MKEKEKIIKFFEEREIWFSHWPASPGHEIQIDGTFSLDEFVAALRGRKRKEPKWKPELSNPEKKEQ